MFNRCIADPVSSRRTTRHFQCQIHREGLLSELPPKDAAMLEAAKTLDVYAAGNVLFYQGHHPLAIYYILSGHVKLYQTDPRGQPRKLRIAGPGDFIGHEALRKGQVYRANAQAMETCRVCIVPAATLSTVLQKNSSVLLKLVQQLETDLDQSRHRMEDVFAKPAQGRIASLLLDFRKRLGRMVDGRVEMDLLLTRAELADLTGTTTETVIRVLNRFKKDRLIDLPRSRIVVIRNEQGLKGLAFPEEKGIPG